LALDKPLVNGHEQARNQINHLTTGGEWEQGAATGQEGTVKGGHRHQPTKRLSPFHHFCIRTSHHGGYCLWERRPDHLSGTAQAGPGGQI